ncbi:MAG: Ig-like domain-containing protein, partial [Chloroflexota bacterium]
LTEWEDLALGKGSILSQANGVEASSVQVTVSGQGERAEHIAMYPVLPSVLATGEEQTAILLQALDQLGRPLPFPCTQVQLTSSSPDVISVASPVSIPCDIPIPYLSQKVRTSHTPGQVNITAGARDLISSTIAIRSQGRVESGLKIGIGPNKPLALDPIPAILVIQLTDADGLPIVFHRDRTISLFSSSSGLPSEVPIPPDKNFVALPVTDVTSAEAIDITAIAPDLEGASISFSVVKGTLEVSLEPPQAVLVLGEEIEIRARVTPQGEPIVGAQVTWAVPGMLTSGSTAQTDSGGIAKITLRPEKAGTLLVTATASYGQYSEASTSGRIAVVSPNTGQDRSRWPFIAAVGLLLSVLVGYLGYLRLARRHK